CNNKNSNSKISRIRSNQIKTSLDRIPSRSKMIRRKILGKILRINKIINSLSKKTQVSSKRIRMGNNQIKTSLGKIQSSNKMMPGKMGRKIRIINSLGRRTLQGKILNKNQINPNNLIQKMGNQGNNRDNRKITNHKTSKNSSRILVRMRIKISKKILGSLKLLRQIVQNPKIKLKIKNKLACQIMHNQQIKAQMGRRLQQTICALKLQLM